MTVDDLRDYIYRLEHDVRLTQTEREIIRMETLGVLNVRPRTVGEAKKYAHALETALKRATSEVPF